MDSTAGSQITPKGVKHTMKKTLAIVLALAMVLCMIPATFAETSKTISDKSYDLAVYSWAETALGDPLGSASMANSVTAKYNYETEKADVTGKFTEDKKMSLVVVKGFDEILDTAATDVEVFIDGKKLEVNDNAAYAHGHVGYDAGNRAVIFPAELTKAGYTDTYLITVKGKAKIDGNDETVNVTETAKVTVKFENNASYKNAKTATISKIESTTREMDAYIVGSKIYLDFVNEGRNIGEELEITFKNENGSLFNTVTWAYQTDYKDKGSNTDGAAIWVDGEDKLKDSKFTYAVNGSSDVESNKFKEVVFNLETSSAIYETKKYDIVVRENVKENDPKGIYFAESSKTIRIGESYTPVVLGVATNKKVDADIIIGRGWDNSGNPYDVNNDVIDIDGKTIIGTKEGVAFIIAKYTTNDGTKTYRGSSAKITVTAGEIVDDQTTTTYYVTCRNLNVRKGPGTSYAKAGMIHRGDAVKVVSIANGWAKLDNGTYVASKYISK
jgi:hypothetical protein